MRPESRCLLCGRPVGIGEVHCHACKEVLKEDERRQKQGGR